MRMVSAETLLSYQDWKIHFTVHTDYYDKYLGSVIGHNSKPIAFFSRRLIKPQCYYTTTYKEFLAIVKGLKHFWGIIYINEITEFLCNRNLLYAATLSEYQRVVLWKLILEDLGPNIQHIYVVGNIVTDTLSILPYTYINNFEPCVSKAHFRVNKLFAIGRVENNEDCFPMNLLIAKR